MVCRRLQLCKKKKLKNFKNCNVINTYFNFNFWIIWGLCFIHCLALHQRPQLAQNPTVLNAQLQYKSADFGFLLCWGWNKHQTGKGITHFFPILSFQWGLLFPFKNYLGHWSSWKMFSFSRYRQHQVFPKCNHLKTNWSGMAAQSEAFFVRIISKHQLIPVNDFI